MHNFKTSWLFPPVTRILSGLFIIIGLVGITSNVVVGICITLVGFAILLSRKGVLLDKNQNRLKSYTQVLFIKFGTWETLSPYTDISVLSFTEKTTLTSRSMVTSSSKKQVFRICLLTENHYQRLLLLQLEDEQAAQHEAEKLADLFGFKKRIFSPGRI